MESQQLVSIAPWTLIFQICNLLLLVFLFKKFLFKPVTEILEKRKAEIDVQYAEAEKAENEAKALKVNYEQKMSNAREEADRVIKTATESANALSDTIVSKARSEADSLKRRAENEIELERRKAFDDVKNEIGDIALEIASQVIDREISQKDHETFIDDFIRNVGEAS
ncbi:MAG: F0F1 ATP synthase subunit B [Clostridia bacterium]|nr:F0F1 ATP synthase subunit B [Clostridia bacterium]